MDDYKPKLMKVFFDSEFTGLHRKTNLISIGMVTENNSTFYAEFVDYNINQLTPWIQENVIENLIMENCPKAFKETKDHNNDHFYDVIIKGKKQSIYRSLMNWLERECRLCQYDQIQFISDCYTYDWMLLVDLLSVDKNALGMPNFINYIPLDLSTMLYMNGLDPDIDREKFCGIESLNKIKDFIKKSFDNSIFDPSYIRYPLTHNSLWDALVIQECMDKLKKIGGM